MENNMFKIFIKLICFLAIGFILLQIATKIFMPKWITSKDSRMTYIIKGFYEEPKNSLDVIFMGNSDVYRGISPIVLWDEYGIASYDYATSGQRMWVAYYMLKESLKYQKPKLIVLNMDSAFFEKKIVESNARQTFDNMKFGTNKIMAITDPVFENSPKEIVTYIFPMLRFHSRWSELKKEDFTKAFESKRFVYKGMDVTVDNEPYNDGYSYMSTGNSKRKIGKKCDKYLNKMIDLCKKNNIELLLIEIPSAESWSNNKSNETKAFADEHDLKFIDLNLNGDEFDFDWKKDTKDKGDHLNVYGATKVSKYLGNYIKQNYDIPDRRNDESYRDWYTDSETYHKDIKKMEELIKNK